MGEHLITDRTVNAASYPFFSSFLYSGTILVGRIIKLTFSSEEVNIKQKMERLKRDSSVNSQRTQVQVPALIHVR